MVTLSGAPGVAHKPRGSWFCAAMERLCVSRSCDAPGGASLWVFSSCSPRKRGGMTSAYGSAKPPEARNAEHICSCFFATRKFRNGGEFLAQAAREENCGRLRGIPCDDLVRRFVG